MTFDGKHRTFDEYFNDCLKIGLFTPECRQVALHAWISAQTSGLEIAATDYGLKNAKLKCPCCGELTEHSNLTTAFIDGAHWRSERDRIGVDKGAKEK